MIVDCAGEKLQLFPEKAVYWAKKETLIIADPHFGKTASFRAHGIPAPDNTLEDLSRLNHLLFQTSARRLVILGDFLHARSGRTHHTLELLSKWCGERRAASVLLVSGNHDAAAGGPPADWCIDFSSESVDDPPFTYCHMPECRKGSYVLSGHIHPAVSFGGKFGGGIKAPCFVVGKKRAILPAFGSFTGTSLYSKERDDLIFVVGEGQIAGI